MPETPESELNIEPRQANNSRGRVITTLNLTGKITMDGGVSRLRQKMAELIENDHTYVILDLGRVGYIDVKGLATIVEAHESVKARGGKLKLLNITQKLDDLLTITKLLTMFDTFEDEREALASFD